MLLCSRHGYLYKGKGEIGIYRGGLFAAAGMSPAIFADSGRPCVDEGVLEP
jgi:hypothetical protein